MIYFKKNNIPKSFVKKNITNIKVGAKYKFSLRYSKDIHNAFKKFTGDTSKIHTSKNFCLRNGFIDKIGYAFFLTSVFSKIYGMYFPGGNELCLKDTSNFKMPFYINDDLIFEITVFSKNNKLKIVNLKKKIINQNNDLIYDGESLLKLSLIK